MATINGENLSPRQGLGAATVLRNDFTPLRILQQGDALRARRAQIEAAAKIKKDAEAAKMIRDNLDYNLSADPYHGETIRTQLNAKALPELMAIQADPTLDETAKGFAYAAIKQKNNQAAAMATANLPIYNGALSHAYANKQYYDPDKVALSLRDLTAGKLPSDVDAPSIAQQALNNSLNEQGITDELVKTHFPDQTFKVEHAGGYGGLHTSTQVKSNGLYKLDKNLDRIKNADGTYAIDIPAAKMAQLDQGYFKSVIDRDASKYQARIDAGEALPKLDRAGLIRTRLAQDYATYNNQHGEGLNAQRTQPRAAATDKKAPILAAPVEGDYQAGGEVPITLGQDASFRGYNAQTGSAIPTGADAKAGTTQKGFYSQYSVTAPLNPTSNGPKRYNLGTTGTSFPKVYAPNEKGQYEWRENVDKPIVGELDDAITLPVGPDNKPITPENKAAYEKAMRDPRNRAESFVQVLTPKDKNFAAKYEIRLKQLTDERNRLISVGDEEAKRVTDATLADRAREEATGETVIQYLPNTGQNARKIDQLTKDFGGKQAGNYRAHREGVKAHQERLRGAASAPVRPAFLKSKTTPAQPAAGNSSITSRAGNML